MRRILVTGMSGTGKSSALAELRRLGYRTIDTDEPGWTEWSDVEGGYVWREDRMTELLAQAGGPTLYVSGTVSNQGRFYDRFDAVVLLSAPAEVLLRRIERRTTNRYGKGAEQRELVLRHLAEVEPLLRRTCTHEIDAAKPLARVVEELAELGERTGSAPPLGGRLYTEALDYDGGRQVTVYVPAASPEAVIFCGDGQLIAPWGEILEVADVPPTMIVGAHRLDDETLRIHEYSPGQSTDAFAFDPQRFAAHERFFVTDVRRWAQSRFDLALPADRTAVCGVSASAELALPWGFATPTCTEWCWARRLAPVTDHPP